MSVFFFVVVKGIVHILDTAVIHFLAEMEKQIVALSNSRLTFAETSFLDFSELFFTSLTVKPITFLQLSSIHLFIGNLGRKQIAVSFFFIIFF